MQGDNLLYEAEAESLLAQRKRAVKLIEAIDVMLAMTVPTPENVNPVLWHATEHDRREARAQGRLDAGEIRNGILEMQARFNSQEMLVGMIAELANLKCMLAEVVGHAGGPWPATEVEQHPIDTRIGYRVMWRGFPQGLPHEHRDDAEARAASLAEDVTGGNQWVLDQMHYRMVQLGR